MPWLKLNPDLHCAACRRRVEAMLAGAAVYVADLAEPFQVPAELAQALLSPCPHDSEQKGTNTLLCAKPPEIPQKSF